MSKGRPRHHELPRYYLRDFCSPDLAGHVWVFERDAPFMPGIRRGRNNPHARGINQAGLHPRGYGTYESDLQRQEHLADETIYKARTSQPIDAVGKEILARYIGLTWRRIVGRESDVRPLLERRIKQLSLEALAQTLAASGHFRRAQEVFRVNDWINSEAGRVDLMRKTILLDHERLHALIIGRQWSFIRAAASHYFVTTDSPVVFDRRSGLQASTLLFPVGRGVMLRISPTNGSDIADEIATPEDTRKLNSMVIMHAHQRIYSPCPDQWIYSGWHNGFAFA